VQQAFNSCMILLLDAMECRTITVGAMKAEQAFVVFKDLYENNVHKLAGLAVEKISWGLQELRGAVAQPPGVLPRGRCNEAMQGASRNEATRALCRTDTVMGHTGMFLLEDPGRRAVASEAFVPMTRNDSRTSFQAKEQQQGLPYIHATERRKATSSNEHTGGSRSADVMQSLRRSTTLRSAPTRYATRSGNDYIQPHGYRAPKSPADLSMSHEQRLKTAIDHHGWQMSPGDESENLLHLQAQLQRVVASGEPENGMVWHQGWDLNGSNGIQKHETPPPSAWINSRDFSHGPHRHSSCPVVPPHSLHLPLLRPAYSSPSHVDRSAVQPSRNTPLRTSSSGEYTPFHAPQFPFYDSNLSPYNHFVSQPAEPLPMSSIAEVAQGYPLSTHGTFHGDQTHMGYPVVIHPSTASLASTLTPLAENMHIDDWSRYTGNEGYR
jgi:hypothetical protein